MAPSSHLITTGLRSDYAGAKGEKRRNAATWDSRPVNFLVPCKPSLLAIVRMCDLKGGFKFICWGLDVVIVRRLGNTIIGQTIKEPTYPRGRSTTSRTIASVSVSVSVGVFGN